MATVIVYGPRACGKTRNAARIAAKFGIPPDKIIDEWGERDGDMVKPGHLHLAILRPANAQGAQVVDFKSLRLA